METATFELGPVPGLLPLWENPLLPGLSTSGAELSGLGPLSQSRLEVPAETPAWQESPSTTKESEEGTRQGRQGYLGNFLGNYFPALATAPSGANAPHQASLTGLAQNEQLVGDADGDGDVDFDDVNAIAAARNTPASGPDDARDVDGDGTITALDARQVVVLVRTNTDETAPQISASLTNDTAPGDTTNSDGITSDSSIGGTVADDNLVTRLWASFEDTSPGNLVDITGALQVDGSFQLIPADLEAINGGTLAEGAHTLYLQAKDQWANLSGLFEVNFTLDTIAPDLDITNPLDGAPITQGARLTGTADGTGSDVAILNYQFDSLSAIPVTVSPAGDFDVELDLTGVSEGLQTLAVTAEDLAGNSLTDTRTVEVVSDNLPFFLSDVTFSEEGLFLGETTEVTFTVDVANPAGAQVQVFELDEFGNLIPLGELFDDGDLDKGDDIAGDGVFNNRFDLTPTSPGELSFIATLPSTGGQTAPTSLEVIEPISPEDFQAILDFNTQINDQFQSLLDADTSVEDALAQIQTTLEANPDFVKADSIVLLPNSIGWETQIGISVVLDANEYLNNGVRGGIGDIATATAERLPTSQDSLDSAAVNLAAASDSEGCNNALVLAPYAWQFEPFDESNEVAQDLRDAGFDVVEKRNVNNGDQNISVSDFKNLDQYDAIAITTHGDNFDGTNFGTGNDVVIYTGQEASIFNFLPNIFDLLTGRLVLGSSNTYVITPSFITKYTEDMPDSIVYVGSCRSTFTNSLANAFLSEGADAFIGYSDYVGSAFANVRGQRVFDTLLAGGTTGDIPGINVDVEPTARFELIGSNTATISLASLQNGTFEGGNFKCWTTEGDTRIISALGPLSPPEGNRMAIISTGLGSVFDSQSSITQRFLVPQNANELRLTYDVVSEEPLEFVGSIFNDEFQVLLDGTIIAQESVNTSTWLPIGGIDFAGGDNTTFHTGFKTISVDLTPFRGQIVELAIQTFDVGDSIYDTAALVDAIEITTT